MTDAVAVFPPGFRVLDSNGDPVSGAQVKFYDAGTSTPKTVYSDKTLSTSLGSIVYTNSEGFLVASQGSSDVVMVYVGSAAYKVGIYDADDVAIYALQDNVLGALDTSTFLTSADGTTVQVPVSAVSADRTLAAADRGKLLRVTASCQITLPDAATLGDNWQVHILHDAASAQVVIATNTGGQVVTTQGGQLASFALTKRGEALSIACDGGNYRAYSAGGMIRPNNVLLIITDRVTSAPVGATAGDRYIVSTAFSTFSQYDVIEADGQGGFFAYTPAEGWLAWVLDENALYAYDGSAWTQQYAAASDTVAGIAEIATAAEVKTASDTGRIIAPGRLINAPFVVKAYGKVASDGTLQTGSQGVTSGAKNSTGNYTVTLSVTMANTNYVVLITCLDSTSRTFSYSISSTTVFTVASRATGDNSASDAGFSFVVLGAV